MPYDLTQLQSDVAQIQHDEAGFGTGRLVAENLILTAAHVLWNEAAGSGPKLDGWQVRLNSDRRPDGWSFRRGNRVAWYDQLRDLALIQLVTPNDGPLRPRLRLRIATVPANNAHAVEARGYPRASKQADRPRDLVPALGRLTAADQDRPLRFGIDASDLPNTPHEDWPGMSGSAVLRQDWPDQETIWVYGVVQAVPAKFGGQLSVARLANAWQDAKFRKLLVDAGVPDQEPQDPTAAVPPSLRPFFVGVPPRIAGFTGRQAELDRLDAILVAGRPGAVIQLAGSSTSQIGRAAVQGMGSVGKTALAVEYAHRYRDLYAGTWWCPAETRIDLLTSLAELAMELVL